MGRKKILAKVKNYKELCEFFGVEPKAGGQSKISQIKDLERMGDFKKDPKGYGYTIYSKYKEIKPKETARGRYRQADYIDAIELLILDLIIQKNKEELHMVISKSKLLKELNMINSNYNECRKRQAKFSKYLDIKEEIINEYFDTTSRMLEGNLETALKNLEKKRLIFLEQRIMVIEQKPTIEGTHIEKEVHIDSFGEEQEIFTNKPNSIDTYFINRYATQLEKNYILETEKDLLNKYKSSTIGEVISTGKGKEYYKELYGDLFEEIGIIKYYKGYDITFNIKHIKEEKRELEDYAFNALERELKRQEVNNKLQDRIIDNATNRQKKLLKETEVIFGECNKTTTKDFRKEEDYVDNYRKTNKVVIDIGADNVVEDVKKSKVSSGIDKKN